MSDWEYGGSCSAILARIGCAALVLPALVLVAVTLSAAVGIAGCLRSR